MKIITITPEYAGMVQDTEVYTDTQQALIQISETYIALMHSYERHYPLELPEELKILPTDGPMDIYGKYLSFIREFMDNTSDDMIHVQEHEIEIGGKS